MQRNDDGRFNSGFSDTRDSRPNHVAPQCMALLEPSRSIDPGLAPVNGRSAGSAVVAGSPWLRAHGRVLCRESRPRPGAPDPPPRTHPVRGTSSDGPSIPRARTRCVVEARNAGPARGRTNVPVRVSVQAGVRSAGPAPTTHHTRRRMGRPAARGSGAASLPRPRRRHSRPERGRPGRPRRCHSMRRSSPASRRWMLSAWKTQITTGPTTA